MYFTKKYYLCNGFEKQIFYMLNNKIHATMKQLSFKDLDKVLTKLEKLQEQADKIRNFVEKKIGCTLEEANENYEYNNVFFQELLSIYGGIEGTIENVYNA